MLQVIDKLCLSLAFDERAVYPGPKNEENFVGISKISLSGKMKEYLASLAKYFENSILTQ